MYVDKLLTGLAAVQTLSRLNRIHPLKNDHTSRRLSEGRRSIASRGRGQTGLLAIVSVPDRH